MSIRNELASYLQKVLKDFDLGETPIKLDYPTDATHGDFSTNIALILSKKIGKSPRELSEEIKRVILEGRSQIGSHDNLIEKVEVAGPGFINITLNNAYLLKHALQVSTDFAQLKELHHGKTVVVEYSSPNIAKPFTIGHFRSTIIGDAIANLLQATGYDVKRDNHLGDWGTQFGKQIYAIKAWGNEDEIETSDRPVKLLVDLYVKFHDEAEKDPTLSEKGREWFKKLEDGDIEAKRLWEKCIQWSWKEFDQIYKELDVTFTENDGKGYGESYFENDMSPIVDELKEKGLLSVGKEGAQIVEFPEESKLPPLMILKKDGATLYATRDLATDKFRREKYGKDILVINEVGSEQSLYFQQIYTLEELLGWYKKSQRVHVKHGLFRFADKKMSTRKGNVIWLEDVLEEAKKRAFTIANEAVQYEGSPSPHLDKRKNLAKERLALNKKEPQEFDNLTKTVGIGALKWNDLKRTSEQDVVFDWDEILNMQGNSGPYLQYTYARTQSVLRKSEVNNPQSKTTQEFQVEERELLKLLSRFSDTVVESAERYSPNLLCTYLFELAQSFNLFYQKCPILKADEETKAFRLSLTGATGTVLKDGLTLLGIQAPEKM